MSVSTQQINIVAWKDELTNFFRYQLHDLDSNSRETETTQTFTGVAGQTVLALTYATRFRYVKSVTISSQVKTYGIDYSINYRGTNVGKIVLSSALSGGESISVVYGYANQYVDSNNKVTNRDAMVYPDFPRGDLGMSKYPRVGIGIMVPRQPGTASSGIQNVIKSNPRISVLLLSPNSQQLDIFEDRICSLITQKAKSFYNFRYVYVENVRNISPSEDLTGEVIARNIDLIVPDRYEIVSYA